MAGTDSTLEAEYSKMSSFARLSVTEQLSIALTAQGAMAFDEHFSTADEHGSEQSTHTENTLFEQYLKLKNLRGVVALHRTELEEVEEGGYDINFVNAAKLFLS